jgi:predicted TIM-barrel enzyme
VGDAFVCACLNANDPLRDMRMVLDECLRMGVNSVSNIGPSVSYVDKDSEIYRVLTSAGITLAERDRHAPARPRGDGHGVHRARVHRGGLPGNRRGRPPAHLLLPRRHDPGGLTGYDSGQSIEQTAERTEAVYRAVREIDPEVILVGHGAAMETPPDAQYMLDHTSGHGFWTGSSTERLPIERAVSAAAAEFASLRFGTR